MQKLRFDYSKALGYIREEEILAQEGFIGVAHEMLHKKTGLGRDFLGWVDHPIQYDREEYQRVKQAAEKIRSDSEALVVIGIGGSYLGARAAMEFVGHSFYNSLPADKRQGPQIFFAGNNLSSTYLTDLLELLGDRDISINVISKSGTTTEPAIAFRLLRNHMERKYGRKGAAARIYVTTDKSRGALRKLAVEEGYQTFVVPDDIGGRYSVLTAVGLLPIAASGADIDSMMKGAAEAHALYGSTRLQDNDCYLYAAVRNALYRKNRTIEVMANYEPALHFFTEWWKQLYGESEGKDGKGIFPAGVDFTTDLHSMGQYIQDGLRNIFETVLNVQKPGKGMKVLEDKENVDGLNFLAGREIDEVNKNAMEGTMLAHTDGGIPNLILDIPTLDAYSFGSLVYFFEKACGISGYLLGVNPFDQPGVEAYKKNMFALLGKPGYEEEKKKLEARLGK